MSGLAPLDTSLYSLSRARLAALVAEWGEPPYRSGQLWRWLYRGLAPDFASMTDLPDSFRRRLARSASLWRTTVADAAASADGLTEKLLVRLEDGQLVETVLMRQLAEEVDREEPPGAVTAGRNTVCLSTQVGCAMGCSFCATGQLGLSRDLDRGECVEQVLQCARRAVALPGASRISNVVFMGMGEPLANLEATAGAIETLTDPAGFGLAPRRIVVSTVGLVPGIRRLAELGLGVRLAVSLHAPDDELRQRLVPVARVYPLSDVLAACRHYAAATGRRLSFEYVLIGGVNDSAAQARRLAGLVRPLHGHVNLIPLNPPPNSACRPSPQRDVAAFARVLAASGVRVSIRLRRGADIAAGCGQLGSRANDPRGRRILGPADRAADAATVTEAS